jgi:hypothetical protein
MHLLQNRQYVTEGIDTAGCNFNGKYYRRDEHTELRERLIALRYLYRDCQCNDRLVSPINERQFQAVEAEYSDMRVA